MIKDVVIIGAGVAGMTSAIYLKRAGISPVLIEMKRPGGQINFASSVENFPTYIKITGKEFSDKVFEQVKSLDIEYVKNEVISVSKDNDNFIVNLKEGTEIVTKTIFIATGKKIKKLDIPNVNSFLGIGLSYCATCDGQFFRGKDVVVIGDTNKAVEESLYLANLCNKVYIISEGESLKADFYFAQKIKNIENIEVIFNARVKELIKDVTLKNVIVEVNGVMKSLDVSGCFAYVGYVPNTELFSDFLNLNGDGYVIVNDDKETSCKGIYAIGDVTNTKVYQLITAASDAAIAVNHYLSNK